MTTYSVFCSWKAWLQLAPTAIQTLLTRQEKKRSVQVRKEERADACRWPVSERDYQEQEGKGILEKLNGNSLKNFVAALYRESQIDDRELEAFRSEENGTGGKKALQREVTQMKKGFILMIVLLLLLPGCSKKTEDGRQKADYRYPPPIEELVWGMSEEEVLDRFQRKDSEVEWQEYEGTDLFGAGENGTYRFFTLDEPLEFLEEEVTATLWFYEEIGLEQIALEFRDRSEQNIEVNVQLKLQETYESSWGTDVLELEEKQKEQLRGYLSENGMDKAAVDRLMEEREQARYPLVSYELDKNTNSPAYGTVVFHGYLAAMLEHALSSK